MSTRRHSDGQALTETLVTLVALVPVFMLIPYLGKYLDVKHKTEDGARYALWERTVYSDPGASWNAGENPGRSMRDRYSYTPDWSHRFHSVSDTEGSHSKCAVPERPTHLSPRANEYPL